MQGVTRISRALLVVITIGHTCTDTASVGTYIDDGALVGIVAIVGVVFVNAPRGCITGVVSAHLAIIAVHINWPSTLSIGANITGSAGITVVARDRVGRVLTA